MPQWKRCADKPQPLTPMLNKDFTEFVGLLNSTGVEYLLVGGYALAAHGRPRYTGDLDIWVDPDPANVQLLLRAPPGRRHTSSAIRGGEKHLGRPGVCFS